MVGCIFLREDFYTEKTEILSGWWYSLVLPSIDFDSLVLSGTLILPVSDTSGTLPSILSILWLSILWLVFSGTPWYSLVPYDLSVPKLAFSMMLLLSCIIPEYMLKAGLLYLLYSNVHINSGVVL
jgi:hypothetical protein